MLTLDRPITIDGISVFRDHADPNQFWYLPGPVDLARREADDRAAFSFLKYKVATPGGGDQGGGFLMVESTLKLPADLQQRIVGRVQAEPGVTAPVRLAAAPFEEGSVRCIALNLQGGGGMAAAAAPAGAFNAVELILGATTPSMDAVNKAAFSLTLSAEGATILEQAFEEGMAPIGVVYDMRYLAMRPALDVTITADFERIFNHFSASLEGQYQFFRAGIEAAFESLVQTGAIKLKVLSFTDDQNAREQEKWALDFFKEDLLSKWFEPSLTPGQLATAPVTGTPLGDVISTGRELINGGRPATGGGAPAGGGTGGTQPADGGGTAPPATEQLQPAAWTVERTDPVPLPAGHGVSHTPAANGLQETLVVSGAGAVLKVNGAPVALDASGRATVTVDPNSEKTVTVEWPPQTQTQVQIFGLFFDFDKPVEAGWSASPPNAEFRAYVDNTTTDPRFRDASGILRLEGDGDWTGPERGAERLRAWIQSLPAPRQVKLDAYASHEHALGISEPQRAQHNMRLSTRRLQVAQALVQRAGGAITAATPHGDVPAAARPGAHSPMGGDPDNRAVWVTGRVAATGRPVHVHGRLRRPASTRVNPPKPPVQPPAVPAPAPQAPSMPAVASLKLKFVRQEERKTLTLSYQRAEAVRRTYAPQGFFGLLLKDLGDKSRYFKEINLDDPFFREFNVEASIPIDFAKIALLSAQVAIDYGNPADPRNHKHGDFIFTPADAALPKAFSVFLNETRDIDYAVSLQYHFDPQSPWFGDQHTYAVPAQRTQDRTLFVNPYEQVEFKEITVLPGEIEWELVSSIEVQLLAEGYRLPAPRAQLRFQQADAAPQTLRLRGVRPAPAGRRVQATIVHRLKDGTETTLPPADIDVPVLVVNDLFNDALRLEFIPLFDAAQVQRAIIDVEYADPAHGYQRRERLEIPGNQTESAKLRLALRDPALRSHRHRISIVRVGGGFEQRAWVTTDEELIPVS
jgi:hypothetical protein